MLDAAQMQFILEQFNRLAAFQQPNVYERAAIQQITEVFSTEIQRGGNLEQQRSEENGSRERD